MPLIQYLARIRFDDGAVRHLPEELGRLGIARPVIERLDLYRRESCGGLIALGGGSALAADAAEDHLAGTNPRPAGPAEYAAMLRAAL